MSSRSEKEYSLSCDLSINDIENLYYEEVLSQDFYDDNYGDDWTSLPYLEMADLLKELINPKSHLDIGCGLGVLVKAMREKGIDSRGVDFSEAIIGRADKDVKPHLQIASSENWLQKASIGGVALITYMEVFEHLPVSVIKKTLRGIATDIEAGILFLTIPSFGVDSIFKGGILINESTPEWRRDMELNIPFQNIVLEDGKPHLGHITLASYRWWTEFFLTMGFVRHYDLEKRCYNLSRSVLERYNYNPYILTRNYNVGKQILEDGIGLARGWYEYEKGMGGRWSNGFAQFFSFDNRPDLLTLCLSFPTINVIQDFSLLIVAEQLVEKKGNQFCWREYVVPSRITISSRSDRQKFVINFKPGNINYNDEILHNVWRFTLISPQWCPDDLHLSSDQRVLSVFVHDLQLQ